MKPKMPEEPIKVALPSMELKLDLDLKQFSSGGLRLCITNADVSDSDDKPLGCVKSDVKGGVAISVKASGREWYLSVREIWEAVVEADKAYTEALMKRKRYKEQLKDLREKHKPQTKTQDVLLMLVTAPPADLDPALVAEAEGLIGRPDENAQAFFIKLYHLPSNFVSGFVRELVNPSWYTEE